MREIKFRAWYADRKIMTDGFTLEHLLKTANTQSKTSYAEAALYSNIMQYADREDKNGKEIYEGFIIKCKQIDTGKEKIGTVVFQHGAFWFQPHGDNISGGGLLCNCIEVEVVGNIYQNPDLLTNTN